MSKCQLKCLFFMITTSIYRTAFKTWKINKCGMLYNFTPSIKIQCKYKPNVHFIISSEWH